SNTSADLAAAQLSVRGIDIVLRANTIKDTAMTELQRRLADIVIEPAVRMIHSADFESLECCIDEGTRAACLAVPKTRDLLRQKRFRSMMRPPLGKRM